MYPTKCFVCTGDIQNGIAESDNSSSKENSILLCKILELPDLEEDETKKFEGRKINYCRLCLNKIWNIRDMLEELERLEKKVLDEKYSIELQLKEKEKSHGQKSPENQLRGEIVTELRAASIESMLDKIRKKRVGQRRDTKVSRNIRIMKNVTIPNNVCEAIQPISDDQLQPGNVMSASQDSQPQLHHQHLFPSNSSVRTNDPLDGQVEDTTKEVSLTAIPDITETSWASLNEECDIKYEMRSDEAIMTIDPLHSEMEHLDFPQQNDLIPDISTKLEVDNLPDVTKFSDAQQITTTEDPPSHKNFICRTCGAGFVSYNQLRIHDRMHLIGLNRKSTVKYNRRTVGKSRQNTKNLVPCKRPKKCEECGKVLSTNQVWTEHVMSFHRGQFKFKCTLCDYGCQRSSQLRRHTMGMHSVNSEDLKCSKCDRIFKTKRARSVHMLKCSVVQ